LYYKDFTFDDQFRNKNISYKCKIIRGNGKIFNFDLPLGYGSMQISECDKKGCIMIYQWKTGIDGFEETETSDMKNTKWEKDNKQSIQSHDD
jgi:hypothetical protein